MSIFKLFAKSPFEPLKELLAKVDLCVIEMKPMLEANFSRDSEQVKRHFRNITKAEHQADVIKNSIRDHLPQTVLLPINKWQFLEILASADDIADRVEDLAFLLTIRDTRFPEPLQPGFMELVDKSLECYYRLTTHVGQLDQLIDAGFKGQVAKTVMEGIDAVSHLEWETDKLGYKFAQDMFAMEDQISPVDLMMIIDISKTVCKFADSTEGLAKNLRRTLAH